MGLNTLPSISRNLYLRPPLSDQLTQRRKNVYRDTTAIQVMAWGTHLESLRSICLLESASNENKGLRSGTQRSIAGDWETLWISTMEELCHGMIYRFPRDEILSHLLSLPELDGKRWWVSQIASLVLVLWCHTAFQSSWKTLGSDVSD